MRRRVVITGIGVVAPGGIGVKDFWSLISRAARRRGESPSSIPALSGPGWPPSPTSTRRRTG